MVYRITFDRFLLYGIDYLSLQDITQIHYLVLSARVTNLGKLPNVVKISDLYPTVDIVTTYAESGDKMLMYKMYWDYLSGEDEYTHDEWNPTDTIVYKAFINPLIRHFDVMIVCDRSEDEYVDVLTDYLDKKFGVPVINLNRLFDEGRVGPIYLDRDRVRDNAVDVRRKAANEEAKALSTSRDGRLKLIGMMNAKEKRKRLRDLGISPEGMSNKEMDEVLFDVWVDVDDE